MIPRGLLLPRFTMCSFSASSIERPQIVKNRRARLRTYQGRVRDLTEAGQEKTGIGAEDLIHRLQRVSIS